MTAPISIEDRIRYEGAGTASELWGGVQANFLIAMPGHPAREVAVLLNDALLANLAERTGGEATPEFRDGAARHIGDRWLQKLLSEGHELPPVIVLSRSSLDAAGPFFDTLLAELGR